MLVLKGHKAGHAVYAIAFSPDGASLVSCSRDRTIRLWNLREGKHRIVGTTGNWPSRSVAFSPDGRTLAWTNSGGLQLYDVETSVSEALAVEVPTYHEFTKVAFSLNGHSVAATRKRVLLWDRETQRLLAAWGSGHHHHNGLVFTSDGRTLAVGRDHLLPNTCYSYEVVLYDLETRQAKATLTTKRMVNDLAFAPNGRMLAAACGEHLMVWDLAEEEPLFQHKVNKKYFQGIAFSPDGCLLATASNDQTVRLWRAGDWKEHVALDWRIGEVLCIAFAPDGMTAAAGGRSGRIVLWDVDF